MCKITEKLKQFPNSKPTSPNFVGLYKIKSTIDEIGKILEENGKVDGCIVISEDSRKKIDNLLNYN